jgi:hypothetical protein
LRKQLNHGQRYPSSGEEFLICGKEKVFGGLEKIATIAGVLLFSRHWNNGIIPYSLKHKKECFHNVESFNIHSRLLCFIVLFQSCLG